MAPGPSSADLANATDEPTTDGLRKPHKLAAGDVVAGRYELERELGRGGYGAVYLAVDRESGERRALKVMHARHASRSEKLKRFEREAALAARLDHPKVVRTFHHGHDDKGIPFIAFELLEGRSLSEEIKAKGALGLERTVAIARQALSALGAAHDLGVVHRDIKPGNLFLLGDGDELRVLDFGIAKGLTGDVARTELTRGGAILGTAAYMAGEQVRGVGIDMTVDIYALGLTLAEALTGKRIVNDETHSAVLMAQMSPEPIELPNAAVMSPIGPVLAKAVAKKPADRWQSASEMADAIDVALGVKKQEAPEGAPRIPLAVGGALAIAAVIGVVAWKSSTAPTATKSPPSTTAAPTPPPQSGIDAAGVAAQLGKVGWTITRTTKERLGPGETLLRFEANDGKGRNLVARHYRFASEKRAILVELNPPGDVLALARRGGDLLGVGVAGDRDASKATLATLVPKAP